jgi:putative transposase
VLTERITQLYQANRQVYGSPRLHAALRANGHACGKKRVARLMRQCGLSAKLRRHRTRTTDSQHDHPVAENVVGRDFTVTAPNTKWVADITGVWTAGGWLYLAVVLDIYSRMVVGWAMDAHREAVLIENALQMARARRHPEPGLLHHSDRGSQYTCQDYQALLARSGMVVSMSRKGDCYDNALMESFNGKLKTECVERESYQTRSQARRSIFEYLEAFYNRQRLHSSLGYVSPVVYEQQVR